MSLRPLGSKQWIKRHARQLLISNYFVYRAGYNNSVPCRRAATKKLLCFANIGGWVTRERRKETARNWKKLGASAGAASLFPVRRVYQ